jgi:hypothetical protein
MVLGGGAVLLPRGSRLHFLNQHINNFVRLFYRCIHTHQTDTPGFASKVAELAADFNVMFVELITV